MLPLLANRFWLFLNLIAHFLHHVCCFFWTLVLPLRLFHHALYVVSTLTVVTEEDLVLLLVAFLETNFHD